MLVEAGADLTYRNALYGNDTLLQMALDRGHEEVAEYLQEHLRARAASSGSRHPIHDAIEAGNVELVQERLAAEASAANVGDHLGRRPLHYAVHAGRADLVDLLLEHGADIDALGFSADDRIGVDGFRPVAVALWHHPLRQRNDYAMARHLLERGARYSITIAAALGDAERVAELLRGDPAAADEAEPSGKRPLSAAAERGHREIVRMLLAAGADPNLPEGRLCPHGYALWAAAHLGHREVAELLLEADADPNADVESSGNPTESAADGEMRALLYRYGGRMRLSSHFHQGNVDTIAALLDVAPELFDEHAAEQGFTHCVSAGHEAMLRLLLARGIARPAGGHLLPELPVALRSARPRVAGARHGSRPAQLAADPAAAPHGGAWPDRAGEAVPGVRRECLRRGRGVSLHPARLGGALRADRLRTVPPRSPYRHRGWGGRRHAGGPGMGTAGRVGAAPGPRRHRRAAGAASVIEIDLSERSAVRHASLGLCV